MRQRVAYREQKWQSPHIGRWLKWVNRHKKQAQDEIAEARNEAPPATPAAKKGGR